MQWTQRALGHMAAVRSSDGDCSVVISEADVKSSDGGGAVGTSTSTAVEIAVSECSSCNGLSVHMGEAECSMHMMQSCCGLDMHLIAALTPEAAVSSSDAAASLSLLLCNSVARLIARGHSM